MAWRKCVLWLPFVLILTVVLTPLGTISYSATTTTIRVDPPMRYAKNIGDHFTINLTILNGVDVFAWQVNMTFDSNVVQFFNATLPPGHFLEGRPEGTVPLMVRASDYSVLVFNSILGDYPGMHGSGTLVTLEFEVVGTGESVLQFDVSQHAGQTGMIYLTYLLNQNLVETPPGPNLKLEDGYFSNVDQPPTASFTYSPLVPDVNETINFDASASYDPDGQIVQYEWDFGDLTSVIETGPTTTHNYTKAKIYTVTLTVIDNATATQLMEDTFNTTTVPHLWYELHSSYSTDIKFMVDHNVAIISADASPAVVTVGEPVTISVEVENQGKETETFDVTAYYDNSIAATTTVENLASGENKMLQLTWDTTDVAPETYAIKVEAILEEDEYPTDNTLYDGTVRVQPPGTPFPIEYVAIGLVGGVVVIGTGVFLFTRRRRTPAT